MGMVGGASPPPENIQMDPASDGKDFDEDFTTPSATFDADDATKVTQNELEKQAMKRAAKEAAAAV